MRPHRYFLFVPCLAIGLGFAAGRSLNPVRAPSPAPAAVVAQQCDVLVYGGSFAGYAAVRTLKRFRPTARVLWVVPQDRLGEIGTVGGQCFWDLFSGRSYYYGGTFRTLFQRFGQGYDPVVMAAFLEKKVRALGGVELALRTDVQGVTASSRRLREVQIAPLRPNPDGADHFDSDAVPRTVAARCFVDASMNGRLLRLAGFTGITGRNDYAPETRQQAVTLIYRVAGVDTRRSARSGCFRYVRRNVGKALLCGARRNVPKALHAFNLRHRGVFRIKGVNGVEAKPGEFWLNNVLMFGVDATREAKDAGTPRYPPGDLLELDAAYRSFRELLLGDEFAQTLRSLPGFERAHVVEVAGMLYVRESVHSSLRPQPTARDFAVQPRHLIHAGAPGGHGADEASKPVCVGLNVYGMDSHGYLPDDPYLPAIVAQHDGPVRQPAYMPYRVLLNPAFRNMLVCGYGINASSVAWYSLRVLPNQTVLGDAAGAAAAVALRTGRDPRDFTRREINETRTNLRQVGAVLEK